MKFKIFGKEISIESFKKKKIIEEKVTKDQIEEQVGKVKVGFKPRAIYDFNHNHITLIFNDGDTLAGNCSQEQYNRIKEMSNKEDIIRELTPKTEVKEVDVNFEEEELQESEVIKDYLGIFNDNPDFEVHENKLYFKGIKSIAIPSSIVAYFIELISFKTEESCKEYDALKMFTFWLLLNPIESARRDALNFVKQHNIPLSSNGMLITFRKVVSTGEKDKELLKFITDSYFKIKRWKKSPKNYQVFKDPVEFHLIDIKDPIQVITGEMDNIGSLNDLYLNISSLSQNTFTDNYTKTKSIKIGQVYKEDEDKIDTDNTKDCSSGIHSGSLSFGSFNSFGDTGVMCLVNPMKIRSVPVSDTAKMRSSELFPVAIVDFDNYKEFVETKEVLELSDGYYNDSLADLEKALKERNFAPISCQENLPAITLPEVVDIAKVLRKRVISI